MYLLKLDGQSNKDKIKEARDNIDKTRFWVCVFFKCWLSCYILAICVISEKATKGLVTGNRRKTMTIITRPFVCVCGDTIFGDAPERQRIVMP